jgi:hypothetical protein
VDAPGLGQFEHVLRRLGHAVRPIFPVVRLHPGVPVEHVEAIAVVDVAQGTWRPEGEVLGAKVEDLDAGQAEELGDQRVCKKGGRLGLTTWPSDGVVAKMFAVLKPYMAPPPSPAPPSPFAWGSRERIRELLGSTFDLTFEDSVTIGREPSAQVMTDIFFTGYGPTTTLAANLDAHRRQKLRREFTEFHAQYKSDPGVQVPRDYLLTVGVRK